MPRTYRPQHMCRRGCITTAPCRLEAATGTSACRPVILESKFFAVEGSTTVSARHVGGGTRLLRLIGGWRGRNAHPVLATSGVVEPFSPGGAPNGLLRAGALQSAEAYGR